MVRFSPLLAALAAVSAVAVSPAHAAGKVTIRTLVVTVAGVEFARYGDSRADGDWLASWRRSPERRDVVLAGTTPTGQALPRVAYGACSITHVNEDPRGGVSVLMLACGSAEALKE